MKNLKIVMCALLVLCGSLVFAACGKKEKTFDASKISFAEQEVVFDRQNHMISVSYDGLDADDYTVSYAVQLNEGERSEFSETTSVRDAGVYKVYVKLTADGYKTYEASEPVSLTIQKRPVEFSISTNWVTESGRFTFNNTLPSNLTTDLGHISWEFTNPDTDDVIDSSSLTAGQQVQVSLMADSYFETNYDYGDSLPSATLTVVDNYVVKQGEDTQYSDSFADAVALINSDDAELYLYDNVSLTSSLTFSHSVKIFGNGNVITASRNFDVQPDAKEMIHFAASGKTLTLENVQLDGNDTVACIYVDGANLVLNDNARIYRGRAALADGESEDADKLTGGVRLVGNASLTLSGGKIYNNHNHFDSNSEFVGEDNRYVYAQNVWLGADVTANLKYGSVNNIWVDAGEAERTGSVTLQQDEGKDLIVPVVYLHGDEENHYASAEYKSGSVNSFCIYVDGTETMLPVYKDVTYHANDCFLVTNQVEDSITNAFYSSFAEALAAVEENGSLQLYKDVELAAKVDITTSLTLNADGHEIIASDAFAEAAVGEKTLKTLFYIPETASAVTLQVQNATLNGNGAARAISAFAGRVTLSNCNVKNGAVDDNYRAGGLFFTGKSSASISNCNILGNEPSEEIEAGTEEFYMAGDIWVGSQARVSIDGSDTNVGYVYVNANEFSSEDKGGLTVMDGVVMNVWLEFDADFGADLRFAGGRIDNLMIDQAEGEAERIVPETNNSYRGGRTTAL